MQCMVVVVTTAAVASLRIIATCAYAAAVRMPQGAGRQRLQRQVSVVVAAGRSRAAAPNLEDGVPFQL